MGVLDFGDLDGMIFVWETESRGGFWMKDTLVPLDIAFFDRNGLRVSSFTMVPCDTDRCPSYQPGVLYLYAVERPAGAFAELDQGAVLDVSELYMESD